MMTCSQTLSNFIEENLEVADEAQEKRLLELILDARLEAQTERQSESRAKHSGQNEKINKHSRAIRRRNRLTKLKSLSAEQKLRNPEWEKYLLKRAKKFKKEKKRAQLKVEEYQKRLESTSGGRGATLNQRIEYFRQVKTWIKRVRVHEARIYGATEGAWATFHRPLYYLAPPPYNRRDLFKYNNPYS